MRIQLIIIGNELLNGKIQDKNAHWLASYCFEMHLDLQKIHIIGDDEEKLFKALDEAYNTSDLIITSGGLGPTQDDITKEMLAKYFKKEIRENAQALSITKEHYRRGNKEFNPEKVKYGNIPQDFEALPNPAGFAPGLLYENKEKKKIVISCPGVPSEFKSMLTEVAFPRVNGFFPHSDELKKHVIIKTYKIPESKIFFKLCPDLWNDLENVGQVSSLPNAYGVDLGVMIIAKDQNLLKEKEQKIIDLVMATPLKEYIWHIGHESLEEIIIKKARDKGLTFGFAESCTGGFCASRITDIPGASSVFWGSVVSYSNEVKMNCLGVGRETLKSFGAVSEETAREMAEGARKALGVDLAVATTGIAGPSGGSEKKPVGTIGIGHAGKEESGAEIYHLSGNRELLKMRFSQLALFRLLELIEKEPG